MADGRPQGDGSPPTSYALTDFAVRAGLEGPQVICTWAKPVDPIFGYRLVRKQGEFPRDEDDGVVVVENLVNPNVLEIFADRGTDLLPASAVEGDGAWWYYAAFTKQTEPPIALQFGGLAQQVLAGGSPQITVPLNLEAYDTYDITVENFDGVLRRAEVQVSPFWAGPYITVATQDFAGASHTFNFAAVAYKYVRVKVSDLAVNPVISARVTFDITYVYPWVTHYTMQQAVLVFKTGRHMKAVWDGNHWVDLYKLRDNQQIQYLTQTSTSALVEAFNLGRTTDGRGALYRYLWILFLELDRVHAYLKAALDYESDLYSCPMERLEHIAFNLGWQLDMNDPVGDMRAELARLPAVWKRRGTPALIELLVLHELGVLPRVQEGSGLVATFADPDLYE